jgi:hypothetical protein
MLYRAIDCKLNLKHHHSCHIIQANNKKLTLNYWNTNKKRLKSKELLNGLKIIDWKVAANKKYSRFFTSGFPIKK